MLQYQEEPYPELTPEQQIAVIRLATRLQAEHESRASSEALIRAAEEAGIERRFLDEAVSKISTPRQQPTTPVNRPEPTNNPEKASMMLIAIVLGVFVGTLALPPLAACCLVSFLFAAFPASRTRDPFPSYVITTVAWLFIDGFVAYNRMLPTGEDIGYFALAQGLGIFVGVEFARLAARLSVRIERTRAHR